MSEVTQKAAPDWPEGFTSAPVVLLVDDEANILNSLRRLLRPAGYEVLTASGGEEALGILESRTVDLIVSDMRMPGMDGAQLLSRARARWPFTLRVLLTGFSEVGAAIAAINEGGIYRYINKPWDDAELLEIVRSALERRGLEREKTRLQALTKAQNEQLRALNASLEDKVRERTAALQGANQELTLAHEKLKKNFFTSVQVLSNLIELRAPQLAGHSRRVADVGRRIAEKLGLSTAVSQEVMLAGLLHDIGKIGLRDDMLVKPAAQMTGDELGHLRKHPINGAAALMSLTDMKGVADIVRAHHERWDGKGYPQALAGQNIPIGARILALANDYDAVQIGTLSAKRMNVDEAKQYVIEGRGFRYDPAVVDAFADLVGRPRPKATPEKRIPGSAAEPGMVLARDLYSPDGVLLLAVDYILDDQLVRQIHDFEQSYGVSLTLCIRC